MVLYMYTFVHSKLPYIDAAIMRGRIDHAGELGSQRYRSIDL